MYAPIPPTVTGTGGGQFEGSESMTTKKASVGVAALTEANMETAAWRTAIPRAYFTTGEKSRQQTIKGVQL